MRVRRGCFAGSGSSGRRSRERPSEGGLGGCLLWAGQCQTGEHWARVKAESQRPEPVASPVASPTPARPSATWTALASLSPLLSPRQCSPIPPPCKMAHRAAHRVPATSRRASAAPRLPVAAQMHDLINVAQMMMMPRNVAAVATFLQPGSFGSGVPPQASRGPGRRLAALANHRRRQPRPPWPPPLSRRQASPCEHPVHPEPQHLRHGRRRHQCVAAA